MILKSTFKSVVLVFSLLYFGIAYNDFMSLMPQPVMRVAKINRARVALYKVGAPADKIVDLSRAITNASNMTNIPPELIVALMKTESEFDYEAVSSKGYKGLMQTPSATLRWASVDTLHGAEILREKLKYSKGDLKLAIALYKGGKNHKAAKYATKTLQIYKRLL